jgi:NADH-quinone oxidoreductase subunit N
MLIVSALLFKLGAAPFHSWIIDIYETAPYGLVMFFDAIWKLCIFFIFTKFFKLLFGSNHFQIQLFLELISIISMIIGSIMPIFQKSIKKFVAYSSIGHTGFAISVYAISNNLSTLRNAIMYIIAHCIASTCFFATLLEISKHRKIETFDDITGLFKDSPMMGCCMLSSMFALIGIPPFINFITKLQILKAQILHERYVILSVSIMYSVLGILYTVNATTKIFNRDETHNNNVSDLPRNSLAISLSFFILMSSPIFYIMASDWIEYILNQI